MALQVLKYIIRFVLLLGLQVFVLNHINLFGIIHPYLYVFFIITLPANTSRWFLLIIAFFTGICVDIFTYTPGLHTSATVAMAFAQIYLLRVFAPPDEVPEGTEPHVGTIGFNRFALYVILLVFTHHLWLYITEAFRFGDFSVTFLRSGLNSLMTVLIIMVTELALFFRVKQGNEPVRK